MSSRQASSGKFESGRPPPAEPTADGGTALERIVRRDYRLTMVETLAWAPARHIRPHAHSDVYHLDLFHGLGDLTLGGRALRFSDWTALLIPPGTDHSFTANRYGTLHSLSIKFRALRGELTDLPLIYMRPVMEGFRRRMESSLRWILEEWQLAGPGSEMIISSVLTALLIDLVRAWGRSQTPRTELGGVQDACRYLAVHYSEPITIAEVAGHCGVRADSFCRTFRLHMRMTPGEYLRGLRLKQACILLRAGYKAADIAERTGFASVHYFSRAFKKSFHRPPMAWRNWQYLDTGDSSDIQTY